MTKFSNIARQVIAKAKTMEEARNAQGPPDSPILTSGSITTFPKSGIKEELQLHDFLANQSGPVVFMLTAVMYLGRGDFGPKQLPSRYREMSETFGDPRLAARQMLGKVELAEYLENGLEKLMRTNMDVDRLLKT